MGKVDKRGAPHTGVGLSGGSSKYTWPPVTFFTLKMAAVTTKLEASRVKASGHIYSNLLVKDAILEEPYFINSP